MRVDGEGRVGEGIPKDESECDGGGWGWGCSLELFSYTANPENPNPTLFGAPTLTLTLIRRT